MASGRLVFAPVDHPEPPTNARASSGHRVAGRRYLGTSELSDGCGLASTHRSANFLLTNGEGWLATAEANGRMARQLSSFHWDNHAILVR
ncbi:MAG: DUF1513 domain-containing protein [Methyloceanibacter sp.]